MIRCKKKIRCETIIYWVRGKQQFCLTRERICCPKPQAEGNRSVRGSNKTKLLLSSNPVYNCFIIPLHFFKIILFTLSTHLSIWCLQYPSPSSLRICKTIRHCDVNITWLIEPMKIRPLVNSSWWCITKQFSWTTTVLVYPPTDLLLLACVFGQQICPRVNQYDYSFRTESLTVFYWPGSQ